MSWLHRVFYGSKLRTAIILTLLLGLLLPGIATSWYILGYQEQILRNHLHATHQRLLVLLAENMRNPMFEYRADIGKKLLEPAFYDPSVVEIIVMDKETDEIFVSKKMDTRIIGKLITEKRPIYNGSSQIGEVTVTINDFQLQKRLRKTRQLFGAVFLLQAGTALLFILPLIYLKVIYPIRRLIRQSQNIAMQQLDQPFVWYQSDEIGLLGKSFESTRLSLKNLIGELSSSYGQIASLLNNSDEGFLSFGRDMKMEKQFSQECLKMLGNDLEERDITKLLYPDDSSQRENIARMFKTVFDFKDDPRLEAILSLLPKEYSIRERCLAAKYRLLEDERLMMILSDITQEKELEEQIAREQIRLRFVVLAIREKDNLIDTIHLYEQFNLALAKKAEEGFSEEDLPELYRQIHTFKGSFSQFNFYYLPKELHAFESRLSAIKKSPDTHSLEKTIRHFTPLCQAAYKHDISTIEEYLGSAFLEERKSIGIPEDELEAFETKIRDFLISENHHVILNNETLEIINYIRRLRFKPFKELLRSYPRYTQQIAKRLNKQIEEFEISGAEERLDIDRYRPFSKTLIHLFRNAIDHGIESADDRLDAGKPEKGHISCHMELEYEHIILTIADDGKGIDTQKLIEKAEKHGIPIPIEGTLMLIFEDAFSTKEDVTELSGRGVGLSAVKEELEKLGGTVSIQTDIGRGTTFIFRIPV